LETATNDNVLHGVEHMPHVVFVGGAANVGVHGFRWVLSFAFESVLDELNASIVVVRVTLVCWESHGDRDFHNLLGKQITLVEHENHGGFLEPTRIANLVKQVQCFFHTVCVFIFVKN